WTVPAEGGEARLLVSHPATESRPLYSPDGRRLAFISTRTGNGDIYVLDFASGDLKRLTFDDGFEQLDSWSYDGKWVYFSSTARDSLRARLRRVEARHGVWARGRSAHRAPRRARRAVGRARKADGSATGLGALARRQEGRLRRARRSLRRLCDGRRRRRARDH